MRQRFTEIYEHVIKTTVGEPGLKCLSLDEIFGAKMITEGISDCIEHARVRCELQV